MLRWTFTLRTPLGDTQRKFQADDDMLHFESDDPHGGGIDTLHAASIKEGGTAAMACEH